MLDPDIGNLQHNQAHRVILSPARQTPRRLRVPCVPACPTTCPTCLHTCVQGKVSNVPGPGSYQPLSALGDQPLSPNASPPRPRFGSTTRDQVRVLVA